MEPEETNQITEIEEEEQVLYAVMILPWSVLTRRQ